MATQLDDRTDDDADVVIVDNDTGAIVDDADQSDGGTGDAAASTDDEGEDQIVWGDATVAAEEEPEGMRNLRARLREVERENKTLKGQPAQDEIGERPTLESCDFDDDKFEAALAEYIERKASASDRERRQAEARQKQADRWTEQQRAFDASFADLRVPGKDAARAAIEDEFPGEQYAYIVKAAGKNAVPYIVALHKSPDKRAELKALADEGSWAEFIALAAIGSREINVSRKPLTQPEQQHRGTSGAGGGDTAGKLAKLEAEADRTGDRSKVIAFKRAQKEIRK